MSKFRWDRLRQVFLVTLFIGAGGVFLWYIPVGIGYCLFRLLQYKPPFDYFAMWFTGCISMLVAWLLWWIGKLIFYEALMPMVNWFFEEK